MKSCDKTMKAHIKEDKKDLGKMLKADKKLISLKKKRKK